MSLRKGVLRTIWKRKWQSFGSILLLIVAVMLYIMMTNSLSSLDKSYQLFKADYKQEDFNFISSEKMEKSKIDSLEEELSIQLEERTMVDISLDQDQTLRIMTVSDEINLPYMQEGKLPSAANEMALTEKYSRTLQVDVGDSLELNGTSFIITGLVYLPDYVYPIENEANLLSIPGAFGLGLMTDEGMNEIGVTGITQYSGLTEGTSDLTVIKQKINSIVPVLKWVDASENPAISTFETEVEGSKSFSSILPLIITLIAIMMVTLLVTKHIEWERKQIGTLKALGYSKWELLKAYISLPLLVGLTGTILGTAFGWLLSTPMQMLYTDFYHIPPITSVGSVSAFVMAIVIPVLLLLVVSGIAIYRKVSSDPLLLMKGTNQKQHNQHVMSGNWLVKRFSSFQTKYRVRSMLRSKSRMFYMLVGSIFSSVTLIFGFLNMNSIDSLFTDTYQNVNKYNYGVYYSGFHTGNGENNEDPFTLIQAEIKSIMVDGKETAVTDQTVSLYGVDPELTLVDLSVGEHEGNVSESLTEGIMINQVIAYSLDVELGDQISLVSSTNGESKSFTVKGIVKSYTGAAIYTSRDTVNDFAGYPDQVFTGVWTMDEPKDQSQIFMIEDKTQIVEAFETMIGPSKYSIVITAGIAIFIGVLIMSLLTNMILEENTYTISMLKVLGYENKAVAKMVLNLYTAVVVAGYLISIPISLVAMNAIVKYMAGETSFALPVELEPISLIVGLLIILFTYQLSLFVSKRKLRKISLEEVMKRQET